MEEGNKGLGEREMSELQLQPRNWLLSPPEASREAARDPSPKVPFPPVNGKDCVHRSSSPCGRSWCPAS